MIRRNTSLFALLFALIWSIVAQDGRVEGAPGAEGELDPTFGVGGKVITDVASSSQSEEIEAIALQTDGKIVAVGFSSSRDFVVVRYNSDGAVDTTFGNQGKVSTDFDGAGDSATSIALQPDGKIVVAGHSSPGAELSDFALARYHPDGSLDSSFGSGGKVTTRFGEGLKSGATSVVVLQSGKIVAAGSADLDFALARYNPDGRLDPTFDREGMVTTNMIPAGRSDDEAFALVEQVDGKVVAAGRAGAYDSTGGFALARYRDDGSLDNSFQGTGIVITDFGPEQNESVNDVVAQADGKLLVAGHTRPTACCGGTNFALARYNPDGGLDTSFGGTGKLTTDFMGRDDDAKAVVLQPDGKIVAAGTVFATSYITSSFGLARYNPDGGLDSSFGAGGKVTTSFDNASASANDAILQMDGKIVAAGAIQVTAAMADLALTRYDTQGALDGSFGTGGQVISGLAGSNNDWGRAVAMQQDSKIVVAGTTWADTMKDYTLTRYNQDGSLDTTFGSGGKVITDFDRGKEGATALAIQADGKILAAGSYSETYNLYIGVVSSGFALARYNMDGSLDTSFGAQGKVITQLAETGRSNGARSLAIQPDGKILLGGYVVHVCGVRCAVQGFALARYNPDGSLDATFGDGGKAITERVYLNETLERIVIQPDGKIVAAGSIGHTIGNAADFAVFRYNSDGTLDTSFGSSGRVVTDLGATIEVARSVVVLADGKLLAGGYSGDYRIKRFALARYNADGSLDESFGANGKVLTDFSNGSAEANDIIVRADGKAIAVGSYATGCTYSGCADFSFALARYNATGALDETFGSGGRIITRMATRGSTAALGAALQPDGKLVAAGHATSSGGGVDFALARYLNAHPGQFEDVPPANTFYTYIECMGTRGIIGGYQCGSAGEPCISPNNKPYFRPNNNVTRGQLAKMLSNAAGLSDPIPNNQQTFADVHTNDPFWTWIERLAERGYISGYECGGPGEPCGQGNRPYFRPQNNATRGQISKIVANAAGLQGAPSGQRFEDVPPSNPFYLWIERLAGIGSMGGYQCGSVGEPCMPGNRPYFRWGNNTTRGQTSKIISNTFFPSCQAVSKP